MAQLKYKRVLLKISGEALAGDKHFGFDFDVVSKVCDVIKKCTDMGVQMGVVIGGGNFWRGVKNGEGYIERTRADHMGMMATVMNCLALADVLEQLGVDVRVQTAIEMRAIAEPYIRLRAMRHLGKGRHATELHDAGLVAERLGHLPAAGQKRRGNQVQLGIEYVAAGVGQIVADPAGERYAGERLLGQGGEVVENAAGGVAIANVDEAVFRQPLADIHAGRLGHARIDRAAVDGRLTYVQETV